MTKRQYINPKGVAAPPGNFSWVVSSEKTLYLAGQVGIDQSGQTVDPKDAGAQVKQALYNIDATLRELGGTLDNIVRTTTYVVGKENLDSARAGRKAMRIIRSTIIRSLGSGSAWPQNLADYQVTYYRRLSAYQGRGGG